MLGLALGQVPLGGGPTSGTVTTVAIDWYVDLAPPVRTRRGVAAANQQFLAFNPFPVVPFGWFEALTEPSRSRPRSPAALAPPFFYQPMPSPFVATGWFEPLAEPVRNAPRSPAAVAPPFFQQPAPSPFVATGWYEALSEPPRFMSGLRASLQQFYAAPAQLRPTPTSFVVLDATETKDVFLGAVSFWDRVVSGEVGVIEQSFTGAEIGAVVVKPSTGASGIVTEVAVGSGGAAVPTISRASVAIRII